MKSLLRIPLFLIGSFILVSVIQAQEAKKILTLDDYPLWSSIVSTSISDDGSWISFAYRPNGGDDTLYFKNLNTGDTYSAKYSDRPVFSSNSKWAAYRKNPKKKDEEKLRKAKKPVTRKGVLLDLASGKETSWDKVSSISFSPNGDYVLVKKTGSGNAKRGSDLLLKNLGTGTTMNIGNVNQYKFNSRGTMLAYTVDASDDDGNGVYIMDVAEGRVQVLDTDTLSYSQLTWDDENLYRKEWNKKGTGNGRANEVK